MAESRPKDHSLLGLAIVSIGFGVALLIVGAGLLYVVEAAGALRGMGPYPENTPALRAEQTRDRLIVGSIAGFGAVLAAFGAWLWRLYRRQQSPSR